MDETKMPAVTLVQATVLSHALPKDLLTFGFISSLSTEDTTLDSCSESYGFIRVHPLAWLLPVEIVLE